MSDQFEINNVLPFFELKSLKNGIFLHLFRADSTPPHLALIINGTYFDLGVKGPRIRKDLDVLLAIIKSKSVKALFISLNKRPNYSEEVLSLTMKKILLQYKGLDLDTHQGKISCLTPIKEFCEWKYDINCNEVNFIFDLLPILYEFEIYGNAYHLNMENLIFERKIILNKYSREDINRRINKLKENMH
jgi:hypothetical protein